MPMNRLPSAVPPTKESRDSANEALIPVRMRVRDGQAIGLVDMDGNDLGLPVTTKKSAQGLAIEDGSVTRSFVTAEVSAGVPTGNFS